MAAPAVYTVTVSGGDQTQLLALPLERDAVQKALAWPLQVMFMAPYDSAQLVISDQGEVIEHDIKWQDCSTLYQHNRKRYYEYKLDKREALKPVWGKWACFNSDGTAAVYNSAGAAKAHQKDSDAFIVMIGGEEMQTLTGEFTLRQFRGKFPVPQDPSFEYVAGVRRWMCATVQHLDKTWRREYFLLDTGAGQSWLRFPHMYNIKAQDPEQKPEYQKYEMQLLGQLVFFRESKHSDNPGVRNINLLGTDFLNQFILVDDNIGNYLQVLSRPNPDPFVQEL